MRATTLRVDGAFSKWSARALRRKDFTRALLPLYCFKARFEDEAFCALDARSNLLRAWSRSAI